MNTPENTNNDQQSGTIIQSNTTATIKSTLSYITPSTYQDNFFGFAADIVTIITAAVTISTLVTVRRFRKNKLYATLRQDAIKPFSNSIRDIEHQQAIEMPISEDLHKETLKAMIYAHKICNEPFEKKWYRKTHPYCDTYESIINSELESAKTKLFVTQLKSVLKVFTDE